MTFLKIIQAVERDIFHDDFREEGEDLFSDDAGQYNRIPHSLFESRDPRHVAYSLCIPVFHRLSNNTTSEFCFCNDYSIIMVGSMG